MARSVLQTGLTLLSTYSRAILSERDELKIAPRERVGDRGQGWTGRWRFLHRTHVSKQVIYVMNLGYSFGVDHSQ